MPAGVWLGAGHVLGRPVPIADPYPHICDRDVIGTVTGREFTTWWKDCPACWEQRTKRHSRNEPTTAATALAKHDRCHRL